ncbi:hypothetical protein B1748_19850 [Paenibacillus sp. MY03]|jgi:putative aldouronate transport system substrate-binding protein|uniref:ABC transporter substrate-binding protein n=1 Tax=Paenibacillus sp. MY03 TaxID=302980 RepID=UPI000B3D3217|nr:ABC transporter substrate-binding protein [Paenibacillus sp. MY03]OUS74977.1 hypothetical protein B1748_19850 [Paenibacillus sp. MY03]
MKKATKWTTAALATLLVLSGCSGNGNGNGNGNAETPNATNGSQPEETSSQQPLVELIWYYPQAAAQPDLASVQTAVNEITQKEINATVKLMPVDFGSYEQKLNTELAANEAIDIVWTSNWLFSYELNAQKGAFLSIDELIEGFPALKEQIPQKVWDAAKIDGKLYAVPSYQTITNQPGFYMQKRFIDKYNFDVSKVQKAEDLEPLLEQIAKNEEGIIPLANPVFNPYVHGMHKLSGGFGANSAVVYQDDPSYKVHALMDTPEYQEYLKTARSWYEKGIFKQDIAIIDIQAERGKGNVAATFETSIKPGGEVEAQSRGGGHEIVGITIMDPFIAADINATLNAVSFTSKHPERAMQLLNLVNTNKDLYNLLSFGIEGKDYTKVADNIIKKNENAGYWSNVNWVYGNVFNGYLEEGKPADTWEKTIKQNEEATVSPFIGFKYDSNNIKTEEANTTALSEEYDTLLMTGSINPDEKFPEYADRLKKAGIDKIIAEIQTQFDAWLAANGMK